ncbi:MAG: cyclic nucleotide-binding domain-containing protein [Rhizobiaceae bacterium]|nr:cyclic nucleotide-binding domain-containing protein [Rhizobiaceae bacterium]MCV0407646.1 cyclic nucleotide-binding domain-containing protein [Rhizobiaceae bacterium]
MALDDDIRVLSRVELFADMTQEQLRLLAFGAENMRLSAGRDLYREGHFADSAFLVVSGAVDLYREQDGARVTLRRVPEGSILGEFALISETRRVTGAMAATDCDLIRLNRKLFRRILEEYPETAAALHRRISARFQAMVAEIEKLEAAFSKDG